MDNVDGRDENLVITMDDVEDEIRYWSNSLIGDVVGEQIPFSAMNGFVSSQWKEIANPENPTSQ